MTEEHKIFFKKLSECPPFDPNGGATQIGVFQYNSALDKYVLVNANADIFRSPVGFDTKAAMEVKTAITEVVYLVGDDPISTNNGYYVGQSDGTYKQTAPLAFGVIEENNPDAVSGGVVFSYLEPLEEQISANELQSTINLALSAINL